MKFKRITKNSSEIEVLIACRDLWNYMGHNSPFLKPWPVRGLYENGCPLCEYVGHMSRDDCVNCPGKPVWEHCYRHSPPVSRARCETQGTLYTKWAGHVGYGIPGIFDVENWRTARSLCFMLSNAFDDLICNKRWE